MKWYKSFRTKYLIVTLLVTIVLMSSVLIIVFGKIRSDTEERIYQRNMDLALMTTESLEFFLLDLQEEIVFLTHLNEVKNYEFESTDNLLQKVVEEYSALSQVFLIDKDGVQYYKTSYPDTLGTRLDRQYFKRSIQGEFFISNAIISRSTNKPIIVISAPIYKNDKIIGVLGASIDLSKIDDLVQSTNKEDKQYTYVVDQAGHIIFHPNESYVEEMLDVSYLEPIQNVISGKSGIGKYVFHNEEKLVAYAPVNTTGWGVLVQIPVSIGFRNIELIQIWFGNLAILSFVIIVILDMFMTKYFMKPINEVVSEINLVKSDRNHKIDWATREDEYGLIREAFEALMNELNEAHNALEDLVKIRTKSLSDANEELETTNNALTLTLEELQKLQDKMIENEKISALSRISIRISHELNTPLGNATTITSYLSNITAEIHDLVHSSNCDSEEITSYISQVQDTAKMLEVQIKKSVDIIKFMKNLPTQYPLQAKSQVNIYDEINKAIELTEQNKLCPGHTITNNCPRNIILYGWAGSIKEVFEKLLDNSMKHGCPIEHDFHISIDVALENNLIKMVYMDNGIGINEAETTYVFEPFFKGNMGSKSYGMGLTQVYHIVQHVLSGEIMFNSKPNHGVVITILIPLSEE